MNIPILRVSGVDSSISVDQKYYNFQVGILSSALEHLVPEQIFYSSSNSVPNAISAVKAMSIASASGQSIYKITKENMNYILPKINHDSNVVAEIKSSLLSGKEVITHTDAVSVPGWAGAGYIIIDPVTGDGAYKIGDGLNGGMLYVLAVVVLTALALFFGAHLILVAGHLLLGLAVLTLAVLAFKGYIEKLNVLDNENDFDEYSTFVIIKLAVLFIPFVEVLGSAGAPLMIILEGFLLEFGATWF